MYPVPVVPPQHRRDARKEPAVDALAGRAGGGSGAHPVLGCGHSRRLAIPDTEALESSLVAHSRAYLDARASGDAEAQSEALRELESTLEWLLGALLRSREDWNPWWWVDGFLSDTVKVSSPVELHVAGRVIWCDGERNEGWWYDPLSAHIRLATSRDGLADYELKFGNAAYGLRRVPYDSFPRRADWDSPEEWMYTFSGGQR
jgi:hypothetical protein